MPRQQPLGQENKLSLPRSLNSTGVEGTLLAHRVVGHRHILLVWDDEFLGIGTVGTALASLELSPLFYSNPSRNIREKGQEARISWCLGGHMDDKNT